jgi:peptidoglycan/LPS O-acetylase OafA/YrhL
MGAIGAASGSYIVAVSFFSVALVGLLAREGPQTVVGRIAGGASYPFYLNHWTGLFVISPAMKHGISYVVAMPLGFILAAALSVAHYLWIDRTIAAQRGEWFSDRIGAILFITAFVLVIVGLIGAFFVF